MRIPAEFVRQLGLREGSTVEAHLAVDGSLSIWPAQWNRKAFALELTEARNTMPMSETVMEELRSGARAHQARSAWTRFERMVAADLRMLAVSPGDFHRAAELVLDAGSALSARDALHLACAETAGAKHIATLDDVLLRNAQRLKIRPVVLRRSP